MIAEQIFYDNWYDNICIAESTFHQPLRVLTCVANDLLHLELAPGPYPPAIGPLSVTPPAVGRITTMTIRYPPDSLIDIGCWTRTISGSYRADSERGRSGIGPTARGVTDSGPTASRQWCQ
jgi:hypothetical protein